MRVFRLWLIGIVLLATSVLGLAQDGVAYEVLGQLNQARAQAGLHALSMNSSLVQAAQRHSNDMANTLNLTHTGSDGSQFWERISAAGYAMTTGGENVLYRWDASGTGAFNQWRNSPPHNANMMNASYYEIGVAWAQGSDGAYYFTMLVAARAGFVPQPQLPPPTNTPLPPPPPTNTPLPPPPPTNTPLPLIPTNTNVPFVPTNTNVPFVPTNTNVPFIPPTNTPLPANVNPQQQQRATTTPMPFVIPSSTPLPANVNPQQQQQVRATDVIIATIIAPLPTNTRAPQNTNTNTVRPTNTRVPQNTNTVRPTATPRSVASIITPTPTPFDGEYIPDLRLVYNQDSFAFINISGAPLYLNGILFTSDAGEMAIEKWDNGFLSRPLSNFPDQDCLQVWSVESRVIHDKPEGCRRRHSWIAVNETATFWRDTNTFTVIRNNKRLAVCDVVDGVCDVSLTERPYATIDTPAPLLATATSQTVVTTNNNANTNNSRFVRLYISPESVALVNLTGGAIDISGWAFESDSGVMLASRWQNSDMTRSLSAYPAGDCLQVWKVGGTLLPKPSDCRFRHSWMAVGIDQQFWVDAITFRVRNGAQVLATCEVRAPVCDVPYP